MKNIWTLTSFEFKRTLTSKMLLVYTLIFTAMYVLTGILFHVYGADSTVVAGYGQSFPVEMLQSSLTFTAVFIAIYVGEVLIQERNNGTIKFVLLRSVSRFQYYLSRILSILLFSLLLTSIMLFIGYVVGISFFGWGDTFVFYSVVTSGWHGVGVTLLAGLAFGFAYFIFGLIALLLSQFIQRISTLAMLMGISTLVGQYIIIYDQVKQYAIYEHLLFFHINLFEKSFSYSVTSFGVLIAYLLVIGTAGYYLFKKQDLYV
ncbi:MULTISPECIES: ABC transporter permease subunit [Oceanobacillus]|uniref:ABC-2 family transporter protein n=4 Tax=Oceanobacillus TaxID=182709 RepID=A0A0A1MKB8_9BACI|nr:ABC transporter permease subunit [Oceanobacillus oncorhynchi]MDM8101950.1 ABC transporter permease subunit [Oceanobacillus oncorhynchi]UUI42032.1 ABC transporter permease [Oceanobacillus oncorhynchi]CEI83548.1 ABC-2 family transporter protein [Oceanobacillus oncorhynchi]